MLLFTKRSFITKLVYLFLVTQSCNVFAIISEKISDLDYEIAQGIMQNLYQEEATFDVTVRNSLHLLFTTLSEGILFGQIPKDVITISMKDVITFSHPAIVNLLKDLNDTIDLKSTTIRALFICLLSRESRNFCRLSRDQQEFWSWEELLGEYFRSTRSWTCQERVMVGALVIFLVMYTYTLAYFGLQRV